MATNLVQQGAAWLISQVSALDAKARKQDADMRASRAGLVTLKAKIEGITDATKRVAARAAAAKLESRQKKIESMWAAFSKTYHSTRNTVVGWMRTHNLLKGTGLADLGVIPLAPLALPAAILVAGGAIGAIITQQAAQSRDLSGQHKLADGVRAGQITPEQYVQMLDANTRAAEAAAPKGGDPLGLTSLADALVPIGLIVLGIIVLPKVLPSVMRAFDKPRARGAMVTNPRRRKSKPRERRAVYA
jgi:hypothetical protein